MEQQMNPTTRKHPRTLNEAFPGGADYACAIERYKGVPSIVPAVALVVVAFFVSMVIA
jgi:hypothetical protein